MAEDSHLPHAHLHDQAQTDEFHVRGKFASRMGFVLAAAGSAVGLGNVWKFPYMCGQNGGAIFILIYLFCIVFICLPAMIAEFTIGRHSQTDQVTAYSVIAPGKPWGLNGLMGLTSGFLILTFYCPVAGWMLASGVKMATGQYDTEGMDAAQMGAYFQEQGLNLITAANAWEPVFWMIVIMAITAGVIFMGIESGIERACKYLMPLLFILMIILIGFSLTRPGMSDGLTFLFKPDVTKLFNENGSFKFDIVLAGMGQAFFSLSLAMGAMMTYASYVDKKEHLGKLALQITFIDTMVALMAGVMIFPAVFAMGADPAAGPGLVLFTLPAVFLQMPLGHFGGTLFFLLLTVAAITSTISLMEPIVTWLIDGLNIKRLPATIMVLLGIIAFGIPVCLSATSGGLISLNIAGGETPMPLLDAVDYMAEFLMMPLGAFVICMFIAIGGWKRRTVLQEAAGEGNTPGKLLVLWYYAAITIAPIGTLLVLGHSTGVLRVIAPSLYGQ